MQPLGPKDGSRTGLDTQPERPEMKWYWWLAAYIVGFVIYFSVYIGPRFSDTVPAVLVGELISGPLLVGLLIGFPMSACFSIGRFLRRRWSRSR